MAYVTVTGGQTAIQEAEKYVKYMRIGQAETILDLNAVQGQLRLLIDKVMSEGGLYAPDEAALALKQSEGDVMEAAFLLRAYRSTLPRTHVTSTIEPDDMRVIRRISSSFRELPGGQMLGPTVDYTHRLLRFSLRKESTSDVQEFLEQYLPNIAPAHTVTSMPKVVELLREQGMMEAKLADVDEEPFDITRERISYPAPRSARMQMLARGETGAMCALAYSSMRGYGIVHPTIGELRVGYVSMYVPHPFAPEDPDRALYIGEMLVTEVESINNFKQSNEGKPVMVLGYGLTIGQNELKAISMAILERSLDTVGTSPAQDEEFVLTHIDCVESSGFVSHLKMPHYVTFQSEIDRISQSQAHYDSKDKTSSIAKDAVTEGAMEHV